MMKMNLREKYKEVLASSDTDCLIGKQGINEGLILHVKSLLKKHKIIKIKILKSALGNETLQEIIKQLSKRTDSHVLDIRGKKFILSRKPLEP
jgi:RNA-binding protein YhbY